MLSLAKFSKSRSLRKDEKGQGMAEYIINCHTCSGYRLSVNPSFWRKCPSTNSKTHRTRLRPLQDGP